MGLTLELQPSIVYEILRESPVLEIKEDDCDGGFFVERVTPELASAFAELLQDGIVGDDFTEHGMTTHNCTITTRMDVTVKHDDTARDGNSHSREATGSARIYLTL